MPRPPRLPQRPSAIGKKFGVNWRDIASLNQVKNPDLIHPGQVFRIPN